MLILFVLFILFVSFIPFVLLNDCISTRFFDNRFVPMNVFLTVVSLADRAESKRPWERGTHGEPSSRSS